MPIPEQTLLAYNDPGDDIVVGAVRLKRGRIMRIGGKIRHGAVGDWAVLESDGDRYFMSNEAFTALFVRKPASDTAGFITAGWATLKLT